MKHLAILLFCAGLASGQTACLLTTLAAGNGQSGNMFDVTATNDVTIQCFDISSQTVGMQTVEVYVTAAGTSYVGNEANAAAWTLAGTAVVNIITANVATPVALGLGVQIPAGTTQGFYVTLTGAGIVNYTNGATVGALYASDANIQFFEGVGIAYPFAGTFTPRIFNGNICYDTGLVAPAVCGGGCLPVQTDQTNSSFNIDGNTTGTSATVARTVKCISTPTVANVGSALPAGTPWDMAINFGPAANPGLLTTAGCQIANIDVTAGPPFWLSTGTPSLLVPVPQSWVGVPNLPLPFNAPPVAAVAHAQCYFVDLGNPDSISLSAPAELETQAAGSSSALTLMDDNFVQVTAATAPCGVLPSVLFYGTSYTDFYVNSNGSVGFTAGNGDFSATSAEFLAQEPRAALFWSDLSPNLGGTVSFLTTLTGVQVDFVAVPHFGAAGTSNSSTVILDVGLGVTIQSYAPDAGNVNPSIIGISPGGGATGVPISIAGLVGSGLQVGLATDAVYEENVAGNVAAGWTSINFPLSDGSTYIVL